MSERVNHDIKDDALTMLRLLYKCEAAIRAARKVFGLDDAWLPELEECYREVPDFLWPDEGPTPAERLSAPGGEGDAPTSGS